ncbi:MAG: hypothetical protein JXB17_08235 [Bacteroidales bacterium]|nr:hypothetical protein [Bacteroidales bacterium]
MKSKFYQLIIICIVLLNTGCYSYRVFNLDQGMNDYLKSDKAIKVPNNISDKSISLTVIASNKCGCYFEKVTDQQEKLEKGPYRCLGFPVTYSNPKDDIKEKVKKDQAVSQVGFIFNSYGDVVKNSLERNLKGYYKNVNIELTDLEKTSEMPVNTKMDYYCEWFRTDDRIAFVKLIAKSKEGIELAASAKAVNAIGNQHLVWFIPLGVLTFPLGYAIGMIIFDSIETNLISATIAEAIDKASAELSKKMADQIASGTSQNYEIYVLLE